MNTKISEAAVEAGLAAWDTAITQPTTTAGDCMRRTLEAALPHLQGEAVPVAVAAGINDFGVLACSLLPGGLERLQSTGGDAKLYLHPQPAELNEVSGDSGELPPLPVPHYPISKSGLSNNAFTAKQMQDYARAALAATGKQQVGEMQGSREQFEAWAKSSYFIRRNDAGEYIEPATEDVWVVWQAAITSRQPAGQEPVSYQYRFWNIDAYGGKGQWSDWSPIRREDYEREMTDPMSGREVRALYAAPPARGMDLGPLRRLYQAYVRLLESGRDRITDLGGTCDQVDAMERMDPDLIEARNLLGIKTDGRDAGAGVGRG